MFLIFRNKQTFSFVYEITNITLERGLNSALNENKIKIAKDRIFSSKYAKNIISSISSN